ncbi:MAG: hypothetical protein K8S23_16425 [Candidatus Cloacimonetes bacterium]|nr:hypothetical protein [Candidatus Cloacimonadota bacterium]
MPLVKKSIQDRLLAANIALENALTDTEILGLLSEFGYDETKINAGKELYNSADEKFQQQKTEYGEQYAATGVLQTKWDTSNSFYIKHVKVARIALKNDYGDYLKLGLGGSRKRTLSGWLVQSRQFYINALGDAGIKTKLAEFGITEAKLQEGRNLTDEVEAANTTHKKEKGEAQQATLDRDKALDIMEDWLSDFIAISRIALEDKPQLLEKMGIVEPS